MSIPPLAESEYETLRATIRERGTLRIYVVLAGMVAWATLTVAIMLLFGRLHGSVVLAPLVVLATAFELNFFVHTGVERVGRYIQVFYEEATGSTGWETTATNYGAKFPAPRLTLGAPRAWSSAGGLDPLFINVFAVALALNFLSSLALMTTGWIVISLLFHSLFAYRIVMAQKAASSQRALDLDRFRSLLSK